MFEKDPVVLLMDNHEPLYIRCITYCCENRMVVLTFPPHCTQRMQSFDVAVNGPFKQKLF